MNQLLQNEAVQTALITIIVVGLNALVVWLKAKTKGSLVESNWCYLQPIVAAFIAEVQHALGQAGVVSGTYNKIIAKSLSEFADQYNLFEGKAPSAAEIAAARAELAATLQRILGG
ncbi:MAG TPA: hypothetical protein P5026_07580 [Kiritimatiellia bacterium]|nr:hypothetical protein [Kiritimatiellia bacterium]HRU70953.1 hypothetical protein [Kiritimatiellia bacterium]